MANTYKNAAVVLTTTAATDLYTTPANTRSIVQSVNVANVDGSDRYVTVTWYDASAGASFTLLYNALVPAGTSMNALDTPLVLEAGDIVRVQASASNTLHATASVLQIDNTSAIVDSSVTSTKLADASVTRTKFGSGLLPIIVCTSGTRPSSPSSGQQIYETDTKFIRVWISSEWVLLSPNIQQYVDNFNRTYSATSSWVATDLQVNITPSSSSSRVRVTMSATLSTPGANILGEWRIMRGGIVLSPNRVSPATTQTIHGAVMDFNTARAHNPTTFDIIDSPNTTSQVNYRLHVYPNGATSVYMNRWGLDGNWGGVSSITAEEVPTT